MAQNPFVANEVIEENIEEASKRIRDVEDGIEISASDIEVIKHPLEDADVEELTGTGYEQPLGFSGEAAEASVYINTLMEEMKNMRVAVGQLFAATYALWQVSKASAEATEALRNPKKMQQLIFKAVKKAVGEKKTGEGFDFQAVLPYVVAAAVGGLFGALIGSIF